MNEGSDGFKGDEMAYNAMIQEMGVLLDRGSVGRCNIIIMNVWEDNDYEQTHLRKALILQCLDLSFSQQFEVDLPYDSQSRQMDLGHALVPLLQEIIPSSHDHQIFYFHPTNHHYVYAGLYPLRTPLTLAEDFITAQHIAIRVRRLGSEAEQLGEGKEAREEREKPRRVPERTIREVLEKVSEWREINQKNPKITLEEAARFVGVPKKTLDDYYMHIKTASEHHFDFQNNLGQKIGYLRRFVREKHLKKKEQHFQFLPALLRRPSEEEEEGDEEEEEE